MLESFLKKEKVNYIKKPDGTVDYINENGQTFSTIFPDGSEIRYQEDKDGKIKNGKIDYKVFPDGRTEFYKGGVVYNERPAIKKDGTGNTDKTINNFNPELNTFRTTHLTISQIKEGAKKKAEEEKAKRKAEEFANIPSTHGSKTISQIKEESRIKGKKINPTEEKIIVEKRESIFTRALNKIEEKAKAKYEEMARNSDYYAKLLKIAALTAGSFFISVSLSKGRTDNEAGIITDKVNYSTSEKLQEKIPTQKTAPRHSFDDFRIALEEMEKNRNEKLNSINKAEKNVQAAFLAGSEAAKNIYVETENTISKKETPKTEAATLVFNSEEKNSELRNEALHEMITENIEKNKNEQGSEIEGIMEEGLQEPKAPDPTIVMAQAMKSPEIKTEEIIQTDDKLMRSSDFPLYEMPPVPTVVEFTPEPVYEKGSEPMTVEATPEPEHVYEKDSEPTKVEQIKPAKEEKKKPWWKKLFPKK